MVPINGTVDLLVLWLVFIVTPSPCRESGSYEKLYSTTSSPLKTVLLVVDWTISLDCLDLRAFVVYNGLRRLPQTKSGI